MSVAVITGSAGLIGSEASRHFAALGLEVVGIDNDQRRVFFGEEASTRWSRERLVSDLRGAYTHQDVDIRDRDGLDRVFRRYGGSIELVIHTAAQPSHDWAAREPLTDFDINAVGTANLLEVSRQHAPGTVFVFTSTNKVYGDTPNRLPLIEHDTRWEIEFGHSYANGIREDMSIDQTLHSVFGASKLAADILVQEYGRYFEMRTVCFRGGTLTGAHHAATELHGFLAYLMRCTMMDEPYTVFGYKGKQVRDVIDSGDVVRAFEAFFRAPRQFEVYNIGGGRRSNVSVLEAIRACEEVVGRPLRWDYLDENRIGDHVWWISDNAKFEQHYPGWQVRKSVLEMVREMWESNKNRWVRR